jgi:hypothetical protein
MIPLIPIPRIDKYASPTCHQTCIQRSIRHRPNTRTATKTTSPLTNQHHTIQPSPSNPSIHYHPECRAAPAAPPSTTPKWRCTRRWKSACWRKKPRRSKPNGRGGSARAYPPRKVSNYLCCKQCHFHKTHTNICWTNLAWNL